MVLLDDVIIATGAAVATASLIVLGVFLSRYRTLQRDAAQAAELAKNVYDSMNSRLTVQDSRIVDLMARFEVISARKRPEFEVSLTKTPQISRTESRQSQTLTTPATTIQTPAPQVQSGIATSATETTILRALQEGPKTPSQIAGVIQAARGKPITREHNGRLLKELFERGLVLRNQQNKPYVYEITEAGRRFLGAS